MSDQPNSANVTRYDYDIHGSRYESKNGPWVSFDDYEIMENKSIELSGKLDELLQTYEALSRERDMQVAYLDKCQKGREELKKKLEQACDVIDAYAQTE